VARGGRRLRGGPRRQEKPRRERHRCA
jgi:hypothetical protein